MISMQRRRKHSNKWNRMRVWNSSNSAYRKIFNILTGNVTADIKKILLVPRIRVFFKLFQNKFYSFPDDKAMRELSDLNGKIDKYSMLIVETENSYHQASVENHLVEGNLKSLLREYERHVNDKLTQENRILEQLQEQVTTDQASKKRGQNIRELQCKRRNMELMMNNTEAQLSEILFEMEKLKGVSARSRDYADDLIVSVEC